MRKIFTDKVKGCTMKFFDPLSPPPPDAIFGAATAFAIESNPRKVDLMVGSYKDNEGKSPLFESVQRAQGAILAAKLPAGYLPFTGHAGMLEGISELVYGKKAPSEKLMLCQALGGTGALALGMMLLHQFSGVKTIALSTPTWPNHKNIALQAGLTPISYPYYDAHEGKVDFDALYAALKALPEGSAVLLHACCHNPTGIDLSLDQWKKLALLFTEGKIFPFFDAAYQGFGKGLDEDMAAIRLFNDLQIPHLVAYSLSKNFSLYGERLGVLLGRAPTYLKGSDLATCTGSIVRRTYSNPPRFSAASVSHLLKTEELRTLWTDELTAVRKRICQIRESFGKTLYEKTGQERFSSLLSHQGFFSYTRLTPEEVQALRNKYAIYMISDGRISLPGLNKSNFDYVVDAIAEVAR